MSAGPKRDPEPSLERTEVVMPIVTDLSTRMEPEPVRRLRLEPITSDRAAELEPIVNRDAYRCSPVSLALAKAEAAKERAEFDAAIRVYEIERHAAILVLTEMVEAHGLESVSRWLRNISAMTGGR